ncbi:hypothetical protein MTP99_016567 [Tenebrio molitor]|nr:hypothetical protein MTP99_016567 [Tenebrio molitor]
MTNVNRLNEICSRAGIYSPFLGLVAVSVHPMCPRNGPHTSLYPTYAGVTCSVCTACAWDRLKPRLKWDDGRREPTSARYELIRRQRGLAAMPCATDPTPGRTSVFRFVREFGLFGPAPVGNRALLVLSKGDIPRTHQM